MPYTARRARLRQVLDGAACVHPGSVFDPISARIAEDLGFEIGMFAGSIASLAVLGAPDIILVTLSEFAQQIRRITRASAIPLLVDADHGYGNALNVMRTVEECEIAGVAALTIEDTLLPRPFGVAAPALTSREEGLGKLRAALASRRDPTMAIVGRTSALPIAGLDEAIARARAYEAAGADALFFTGVDSLDQLRALHAALSKPIILGGGKLGHGQAEAMAALGVRIALLGHQPFMAAIRAVHETLAALRAGTAPSALTNQPSAELVRRATRQDQIDAASAAYLT